MFHGAYAADDFLLVPFVQSYAIDTTHANIMQEKVASYAMDGAQSKSTIAAYAKQAVVITGKFCLASAWCTGGCLLLCGAIPCGCLTCLCVVSCDMGVRKNVCCIEIKARNYYVTLVDKPKLCQFCYSKDVNLCVGLACSFCDKGYTHYKDLKETCLGKSPDLASMN